MSFLRELMKGSSKGKQRSIHNSVLASESVGGNKMFMFFVCENSFFGKGLPSSLACLLI